MQEHSERGFAELVVRGSVPRSHAAVIRLGVKRCSERCHLHASKAADGTPFGLPLSVRLFDIFTFPCRSVCVVRLLTRSKFVSLFRQSGSFGSDRHARLVRSASVESSPHLCRALRRLDNTRHCRARGAPRRRVIVLFPSAIGRSLCCCRCRCFRCHRCDRRCFRQCSGSRRSRRFRLAASVGRHGASVAARVRVRARRKRKCQWWRPLRRGWRMCVARSPSCVGADRVGRHRERGRRARAVAAQRSSARSARGADDCDDCGSSAHASRYCVFVCLFGVRGLDSYRQTTSCPSNVCSHVHLGRPQLASFRECFILHSHAFVARAHRPFARAMRRRRRGGGRRRGFGPRRMAARLRRRYRKLDLYTHLDCAKFPAVPDRRYKTHVYVRDIHFRVNLTKRAGSRRNSNARPFSNKRSTLPALTLL
jgi:hypothetical protein